VVTFATLCYLRRGNTVLLQRKARGLFGEGKWNAPGGKMLMGELPERAATREMHEETGLKVSGLRFHGILNFHLGETKKLDQSVFLFSSQRFTGKMQANDEGELRWFSAHRMPYDKMWPGDHLWIPLMLEGKSFVGDFYFTDNYTEFVSHQISETNFALRIGSRRTPRPHR
jgi:8-oxo-dGTP pyrophosphatase MutT (NUDIX family)